MSEWMSPPTYVGMLFAMTWMLAYRCRMLEEPTDSMQLKVIRFICAGMVPLGTVIITAGIIKLFY